MDYFYIIWNKENINLKKVMLKKGFIEFYIENIFMGIISAIILISSM